MASKGPVAWYRIMAAAESTDSRVQSDPERTKPTAPKRAQLLQRVFDIDIQHSLAGAWAGLVLPLARDMVLSQETAGVARSGAWL